MKDTPQDLMRKIAEKHQSPRDILRELSEVPFSNFMIVGMTEHGNWCSLFSQMTLDQASYALLHLQTLVQQKHALQLHHQANQ